MILRLILLSDFHYKIFPDRERERDSTQHYDTLTGRVYC